MTEAVDLYAAPTSDLEAARRIFEAALSVTMELHDSSWRGGDYFLGLGDRNERFILQRNRLAGDEPAEERHPNVNVILYVESTNRSPEILELLAAVGFRQLWHKEASENE
jgi:hypothetical protein